MPKTAITGSLITLEVNKAALMPLHKQIADRLRDAVQHGRLVRGTKLPSTRVFANELEVSRNTVVQAFETLVEEGIFSGRVGAGTFVTSLAPEPAEASDPAGPAAGSYPFRQISRRGRGIIGSASAEFAERPTSFMPDVPDLREFPIKTWMRLLNETSGRLTGEILAETSNAGYEPLRIAIAQHLNAARGMNCNASQVVVTTGSQQSLDLVCRMMLDPGDPVWIENPSYVGARAVMGANGAVLYPSPVDGDGLRVEEAIEARPVPRMVHVSASRQYPLGGSLSMARRERLLRFAGENGAWILEDDYDNEFRYEGQSMPAVFGLDQNARTFHVGTFSKILLPSLRLGYLVVPEDLAAAFGKARAILDRHASLIEQMVLSEFMLRGLFVSHVRRMRALYRTRQTMLVEGLRRAFGRGLQLEATETGIHLVLRLASRANDLSLVRQAAARGVIVRPLSPYYSAQNRKQGLLLGFAAFNEGEIQRGLHQLAPMMPSIEGLLPTRSLSE